LGEPVTNPRQGVARERLNDHEEHAEVWRACALVSNFRANAGEMGSIRLLRISLSIGWSSLHAFLRHLPQVAAVRAAEEIGIGRPEDVVQRH
jgi:hypothetical protein